MLELTLSLFAGGRNLSGSLLKSTILVTINGHSSGPELPYSNANFCFLKNPQDSSFIMVGGVHDSKSLQIYDFKSNAWTDPAPPNDAERSKIPVQVNNMACALNYYYGDLSIILVGGDMGSIDGTSKIQVYTLSTGFWSIPSR